MSSTAALIDKLDLTRLNGSNVVVYANMRNEILRLRAWLDHYRRMGVSCFAVVDNGSTDGTYELLSAQRDVMVIRTEESFAAANYGVLWHNRFRRRLTERHWVLAADADEFFVYRGWPLTSLPELVERLEEAGADAVIGFMLDMYPDGALSEAVNTPTTFDELLRSAPLFDSDYVFMLQKRKPWAKPPRLIDVIGGPRIRALSSVEREIKRTWIRDVLQGQIDRIIDRVPASFLPFLAKYWPRQPPKLTKVPLVRAGDAIQYLDNHTATMVHPYCENAVLLHFKYLADFSRRVKAEMARQEHYRRGLEYQMYAQMLRQEGDISFKAQCSARFESADDLIKRGLIRNIFHTYIYS